MAPPVAVIVAPTCCSFSMLSRSSATLRFASPALFSIFFSAAAAASAFDWSARPNFIKISIVFCSSAIISPAAVS